MPCGLTAPKPSTVQRSTGSSLARRLNRLLSYWPRTGQGVRSALPSSRFARTPRDVRGIVWRTSRDGSLCRERVAAVSGGRSSRRRRTGDGRTVAVSLPRTQSRTTTSALPPTTPWGLWRLVWCGASGRTSDTYGLQTLDLVPDRRRAERRQPGRRRLRVGASAAGACRDSRGARGGVRAVGAEFAAPSREGAPRWERTPGSL